jgi:hypothetical protein
MDPGYVVQLLFRKKLQLVTNSTTTEARGKLSTDFD